MDEHKAAPSYLADAEDLERLKRVIGMTNEAVGESVGGCMDQYDYLVASTAMYPKSGSEKKSALTYTILGLNGEAGELADKLKKIIRDKKGKITPDDQKAMALELGDVLWYVSRCACELGYDLDSIAQMNIDKLASRAARGTLSGSGDNR